MSKNFIFKSIALCVMLLCITGCQREAIVKVTEASTTTVSEITVVETTTTTTTEFTAAVETEDVETTETITEIENFDVHLTWVPETETETTTEATEIIWQNNLNTVESFSWYNDYGLERFVDKKLYVPEACDITEEETNKLRTEISDVLNTFAFISGNNRDSWEEQALKYTTEEYSYICDYYTINTKYNVSTKEELVALANSIFTENYATQEEIETFLFDSYADSYNVHAPIFSVYEDGLYISDEDCPGPRLFNSSVLVDMDTLHITFYDETTVEFYVIRSEMDSNKVNSVMKYKLVRTTSEDVWKIESISRFCYQNEEWRNTDMYGFEIY